MTDHLLLACARCGRPAAEFSLLPATAEGEGWWYDRNRLERAHFMGLVTKFGSTLDELRPLFNALRDGDYEAARKFDPDFSAFHCWECGLNYCQQCWQIGPPVFDEGFYDYTNGVCPQGHEQTVDD